MIEWCVCNVGGSLGNVTLQWFNFRDLSLFFPESGVGWGGGEGSEDFGCLTKKFTYSPFKAL